MHILLSTWPNRNALRSVEGSTTIVHCDIARESEMIRAVSRIACENESCVLICETRPRWIVDVKGSVQLLCVGFDPEHAVRQIEKHGRYKSGATWTWSPLIHRIHVHLRESTKRSTQLADCDDKT